MLKELAWDVLRKGATIERARAAGLFADELVEGGRVSDLATVLCEIAQHDAGLALAVFSHFTARALSGEVAPGGELLAFSPFLESEATLSGEALSGRIPSVALAPLAQQAVVALQGGGFALVSLAGARLSEAVATLGSRSCPLVDISFDRARAKSLGDGADVLARYSIGAAAIALGLCRGSLDEAVAYAKTRRQGGREIIGWSEVRMLLGDIATQHTFATLAFEHARDAVDARASGWQRSATALAIRLQELACELSSSSLQVLGGAGYTTEFKQEARFRDAFHTQHVLGSHPVRKLRAGSSER